MHARKRRSWLVVGTVWFLSGCGTLPVDNVPTTHYRTGPRVDFQHSQLVKAKLYAFHRRWQGVRYRLGGLSRKGIDCSGLIHVMFKTEFGIVLPRVTEAQARVGVPVSRANLRPGDLVFFKTRPFTRHVGVFLEDGKFLHTSTRQGVTISRLDNQYWRAKYWKAVRIVDQSVNARR